MKNILITPSVIYKYKKTITFNLEINWYKYANKLNFNLVPIIDLIDLKKKIKIIKPDGLIISGGGDISNIKKNFLNNYRDKNEINLFNYFYRLNLPIMAVCRGFQLLCGLNKNNLVVSKRHVNKSHKIKIVKKNNLFNYRSLTTNSYHKYCTIMHNGIEVIGKHQDGSIEIATMNENTLMLMFHPERKNFDQNKIDKAFKNFFKIK